MTPETTDAAAEPELARNPGQLAPGTVEANGKIYMVDAKGALIPIEMVKAVDRLEDELVRTLFAPARELATQAAEFKAKTFADIDAYNDLLAERYGAKATVGGAKGNITLAAFDGTLRITVQIADVRRFGSAILAAKKLVDECVVDWLVNSNPELAVIVNDAFQIDKEGDMNHGRIFALLRYNITDPRWLAAMDAIRDSITIEGSRRHVRFHTRVSPKAPWRQLSLDAATA
jgi:hypothetical protein